MLLAIVNSNGTLGGLCNDPSATTAPAGYVQLTTAQYAAWSAAPGSTFANGVLTAPPPPPPSGNPVTITTFAYFNRFLAAETTAIHTYALTQPATTNSLAIFNYLLLASAAGSITLTDSVVTTGHAVLVSLGLLTQARSTAILTP